MKEYTRMKKTFCDFCEAEIKTITSSIKESTVLKDKLVGVEIKLYSPNTRRFAYDICRPCTLVAIAQLGEVPQKGAPTTK